MMYRNDIEALAARKDRLASEVESKTRELDATSRMLDEMKAKAKLPVLPNIRVASPCTADWKAMAPVGDEGERVRHCGSCDKSVYNLSNMTRDEAEALILAKEGRLCVRYYQRKDGTILLKDCMIGTANARKRRLIAVGAAALLAGASGAAFTMNHRSTDTAATIAQEPQEEIHSQVEVAYPDDPPPPPPAPMAHHDPVHDWVPMQGDIAAPEELEPIMGGMKPPPVETQTELAPK